jgi:hypothetical protein
MGFIILAVGGFLVWKNWDKISGLLKNNLSGAGPMSSPRPSPEEEGAMFLQHRASQAAMYSLRDQHHEEYDRYVQGWIEAHQSGAQS